MKDRKEISIDAAGIKQAIAHYLSRQGSAEFDPHDVALLWSHSTGEITANALSRRIELRPDGRGGAPEASIISSKK